ncbi:MAG: type II secretion system protein [Phycisphaerales bacterium]|nr:type II secretion system GspH family protein [Phycisphaerae bacterium]NNF43334.1 type II secretion system protein [Phycisphaerales bacterium]NNM25842.1 type II secretion system protein [Phycisphaerales bacterium]
MPVRRRHGFTLIETVASLVILAIAVPPMVWAIREAHTQRVNPVMASRARWLAMEKIEDVIADRHSSTRGWSYLIPANYVAESPVTGWTGFDRTVTLTEYQADLATTDTDGGYMVVDVAVSWDDAKGTARTLTLATVVTEYTP